MTKGGKKTEPDTYNKLSDESPIHNRQPEPSTVVVSLSRFLITTERDLAITAAVFVLMVLLSV